MLNTIPTHPNADSYITVEEADAQITDSAWTALSEEEKEVKIKRAMQIIDSHRFNHEKIIGTPRYYRAAQKLQYPRTRLSYQWTANVNSADSTSVTTSTFNTRSDVFTDFCSGWALIITDGPGKGQTVMIDSYEVDTGKITIVGTFTTTPTASSQILIVEGAPDDIKNAVIRQVEFMLSIDETVYNAQAQGIKSRSIDDISESYIEGAKISKTGPEVRNLLDGYIDMTGELC